MLAMKFSWTMPDKDQLEVYHIPYICSRSHPI